MSCQGSWSSSPTIVCSISLSVMILQWQISIYRARMADGASRAVWLDFLTGALFRSRFSRLRIRLQALLEHLVGCVEAVGALEGDGVELQRADGAFDRLG